MTEHSFDPSAHAARDPESLAIVDLAADRRLTYRQLSDRSAQLANAFHAMGLRPGDHMAVFIESGCEFVELYWAAIRGGLYLTAVNNHLTASEAAYIVDNCDAEVLVVSDTTIERAQELVADTPSVRHRITIGSPAEGHRSYEDVLAEHSTQVDRPQLMGRTMFYSSGSTGRPKGVRRDLSGRALAEGGDTARELHAILGLGPGDVYLSPAPLYHAAAATYADATTANGATLVVMGRFDPEGFLKVVQDERVTLVQMVPTMMIRIMKLDPAIRAACDVSSLRAVVHGAGPCPTDVKRAFIEWLGPIVHEYYGGTEDLGHTSINSQEWLKRPGSVGRAAGAARLRIVGDDGNEMPVGQTGLVYFDSPDGAAEFGYHKTDEGASSARHPEHPTWTTLGDIGHIDADGYLYLSDRRGHMIVRGGVNVYPREVEDGLVAHEAVADVAVFGVAHPDLGEEVIAVVEAAPGFDPSPALGEELIAFARSVMAHYKAPTRVEFVKSLPRSPTGKLIKGDVRAAFMARP